MRRLVVLSAVLVLVPAGCTRAEHGAVRQAGGSAEPATTTAHARPAPARSPAPATGDLNTGPLETVVARSCPFIGEATAAGDVGARLARVTVIRRSGKPTGCRFYAVQGTPFQQSEHLPGPNQPMIEITSGRYADAHIAFDTMIEQAKIDPSGGDPATLPNGDQGISYRMTFDPADGKGQDWAYAFATGTTVVTVRIAETNPAINARYIAGHLSGI